MIENRDQEVAGGDPEERAFSGKPDMPPSDPDQPQAGNDELLRPSESDEGDVAKAEDPHGDYGSLPGYGG